MLKSRPWLLIATLATSGCGDDGPAASGGGSTSSPTTGTPSSTATSVGVTSTASSSDSATETSATDNTVGTGTASSTGGTGPVGPLDCGPLCDPYEGCDESVHLSCFANCENTAVLDALDEACGTNSAAYFECIYTLDCEDAIQHHGDGLDPNPCDPLLDSYVDACFDAAPASCDAYCTGLLPCLGLPPTPENEDGCRFECLFIHAGAAVVDSTDCDAAVEAMIGCIPEAECVDERFPECDEAVADYEAACATP